MLRENRTDVVIITPTMHELVATPARILFHLINQNKSDLFLKAAETYTVKLPDNEEVKVKLTCDIDLKEVHYINLAEIDHRGAYFLAILTNSIHRNKFESHFIYPLTVRDTTIPLTFSTPHPAVKNCFLHLSDEIDLSHIINIDIKNITPAQFPVLNDLMKKYLVNGHDFLHQGHIYSVNGKLVRLNRTLVKYKAKKEKNGIRFAVQSTQQLGYGLFGRVNLSHQTLIQKEDGSFFLKNKEKDKSRAIKFLQRSSTIAGEVVDAGTQIEHECGYAQHFPELHVKRPAKDLTNNFGAMIMKELQGGDVFEIFSKEMYELTLEIDQRIEFAIKLYEALKYMHSKGIIHRDLKPENLHAERDEKNNIKHVNILDFGSAKNITRNDRGEFYGSLLYAAPECFEREGTDIKSDNFSAARVLWLLFGSYNLAQEDAGDIPKISSYLSPSFSEIPNLFVRVKDFGGPPLSEEHQKKIHAILLSLNKYSPKDRPNEDVVIRVFKEIQEERAQQSNQVRNKANVNRP